MTDKTTAAQALAGTEQESIVAAEEFVGTPLTPMSEGEFLYQKHLMEEQLAAAPMGAKWPTEQNTGTPEPGLPSAHQDHALNFITDVQLKGDAFKAGRDALVAELNGKEREFEAIKLTMRDKFDAELGKISDAHLNTKDALQSRIANMDLGLDIITMAIEHYNERVRPK